jgi:hypothetical protein
MISNNECRNGEFLYVIGFKAITRFDLPSQGVGMGAAMHEEPHVIPVPRNNRSVVDREVEAEDAQSGGVAAGIGLEDRVLGIGRPSWDGKMYAGPRER